MVLHEGSCCDNCGCLHEESVSCPATFTPNSQSWDGYGLDKYGSTAYGSPTTVLPVVKRSVFALVSGYNIKNFNDHSDLYPHSERVYVYSYAENKAYKMSSCTAGYYFTVEGLKMADLSAFVDTRRVVKDISASVTVITPAFQYGRTMTMELNASDYAGNRMKPFIITFVIEDEE